MDMKDTMMPLARWLTRPEFKERYIAERSLCSCFFTEDRCSYLPVYRMARRLAVQTRHGDVNEGSGHRRMIQAEHYFVCIFNKCWHGCISREPRNLLDSDVHHAARRILLKPAQTWEMLPWKTMTTSCDGCEN